MIPYHRASDLEEPLKYEPFLKGNTHGSGCLSQLRQLQMPASHKHPPGPRMLPGTMLPLQKSQGSHKEDITV